MTLLAIIDATSIDAPDGPATLVAGLSLVERNLRLAQVCGADELVVVAPEQAGAHDLGVDIERPLPLTITHRGTPFSPARAHTRAMILDGGAVIDRGFAQTAVKEMGAHQSQAPRRDNDTSFALLSIDRRTDLQALVDRPAQVIAEASPAIDGGWSIHVDSHDAARQAANRLWNSCRKPQDGLISRHFNRHISLAISRFLAPTRIVPNHISIVTFTLGILGALAAASGEYMGFLLAGLLYQANSIVDGVDGELARVRYEFSVLGEWLDTLSDDLSDFLMYLGLGIGAWHTLGAPGPFHHDTWLVLGGAAAIAKLATMTIYYRWLIAHGRGDIIAFQWDFRDLDGAKPTTPITRALAFAHYFFRKDFIVFTAMVLGILGYLPFLLFALAPGNAIVATSVVVQQLRNRAVHHKSPA